MNLYRPDDIKAIDENIDDIMERADKRYSELLEPTIFECLEVQKIIKDYIKNRGLIIYGGTAYNELIKAKNPKDAIYKDGQCKDIEFYSHQPIHNLKELCIILNEKKFKYVQGKNAQHPETYTIFVNFIQYCDITYMPGNIYYNMKTLKLNGFVYSHPSFILVDILRQYNDPLLSYWRLKDKTYSRGNKLLKNYPLELEEGEYKFQDNEELNKIYLYIFENIYPITTLIHLGSVANNFYINKKIILNEPLVCISTSLKNDVLMIYQILLKYLSTIDKLNEAKEIIKIEEYNPFFQFWDRHVIFYLNNSPIITLLGNNYICLPYHNVTFDNENIKISKLSRHKKYYKITRVQIGGFKSNIDKPLKVATFILLLNYHLVNMHYNYINKFYDKQKKIEILMRTLLNARNDYLTKNKLTVLDKSIFEEFIIQCVGETMNPGRKLRLDNDVKRKKGIRFNFIFDPNKPVSSSDDTIFQFENTSGNLIKNINKLFIEF
jgi:hypothetical protein